MVHKVKNEEPAEYRATRVTTDEERVIAEALSILEKRVTRLSDVMGSPADVRRFLTLEMAGLEHELFSVMWLDTQNRLIAFEEMFRGTLSQTSVYPREVLKAAVRHNAGAVVFCHNHPSGIPYPSRADELLTTELKNALKYLEVRVLDHIIVAGVDTYSFAEHGLL